MFPMTITVATKAQLQAVMSALSDINEYAQQKAIHSEPQVPVFDTPKPVAVAVSAEAPAPTAPTATTVESPSEPVAEIQVADVNASIIGLAKAKGRDAAVAVLQQFGVAKVPELAADKYAAVIAAAQKAMA
jgi:hypothetical protein